MLFANIKYQMHKQSTEGKKYSKEMVLNSFSYKRQADMLFI